MDGNMTCECECEIELFGEFCLSTAEARALILAYSGADVIREWRRLTPENAHACAATAGAHNSASVYVAGVRKTGDLEAHGTDTMALGQGCTPAEAIEDLVWRLIGPRLLADGRM